jgi:hypothetical protein
MKFGLDTFGGMNVDANGNPNSAAQVIRDVVEQAVSMSAPQLKLASVHEDGSPDISPTGDEDGQAAARFAAALLADN